MLIGGSVLVGKGKADKTELESSPFCGVAVLAGSGVHVAGIWKGATVEICKAGPSGRCHSPRHSQTTRPNKKQARTERNVSVAFWKVVIRLFFALPAPVPAGTGERSRTRLRRRRSASLRERRFVYAPCSHSSLRSLVPSPLVRAARSFQNINNIRGYRREEIHSYPRTPLFIIIITVAQVDPRLSDAAPAHIRHRGKPVTWDIKLLALHAQIPALSQTNQASS